MTLDCIDLRSWALKSRGFDYQLEEGGDETGWSVEVPCRRGLIYPYGGDDLLAWTDSRGKSRFLLALDSAVKVHQRGDEEFVVRFPFRLLDRVARILGRPTLEKSRKQRVASEETRQGASQSPGVEESPQRGAA